MGREIKDSEDMEKQREELRASYRSLILDVPALERPEGYKTVTDLAIRFLSNANPVQRLNPVISDVIRRSVQSEARPWQPSQTAEVLRHMESYAMNLWDYPWKTEFHTITMFSGFFKIKIENRIFHPDDLLLLLGYKRVVHCFQLLQMPHRSDVGLVAFDLFLASIECSEMERVANAVKPIGILSRIVFEVRQEVMGDGRVCADHVRERHRLVKAGRGKSTPTGGKAGEGGVGGGVGKGEGVEEEMKELGEGEGGGRTEGGVVGRGECGGGGGGKSIQTMTGLTQSNLRGLGRDGGVGSGAGEGGGSGESEAPYSRSIQTGSRAFQVDPKQPTAAAGSHGNSMRTEPWRGSGGAHPETENVYDAVEDLSRIDQSVYYGFPSSDKSKLGTLRAAATTTRKEKKDVVPPPRVTGPTAAAATLWGQAAPTTEESNLSFSTFRQERSRSGAEFCRESTSKRSSYHTIESGGRQLQESRDRSGSQRNQSDVMSLRGRGVFRVKGQAPDAETLGFGTTEVAAAIHRHHGYGGTGSDVSDDDAVATLLNLSPDQMKDPATRRQVLAQLEPTIRQNAPPPPPPPPPSGSARGPSSTRPGTSVDTCSPYQPWQFQASSSDLPRPPISAYQDHSQTMTLTPGRPPSGTLTSGKTRDPWKSDDLERDETWQCGSCSYENRPIDDACHVCNTSRYL